MTVDDLLLATPSPLSLGGRLRAVGLGCDGETAVVVDLREATAELHADIDVGHLLAEHRAACAELRRLRHALSQIAAEDYRGPEPRHTRIALDALRVVVVTHEPEPFA